MRQKASISETLVSEENELKYSGEVGRSGASENLGLIKMFEQKYK